MLIWIFVGALLGVGLLPYLLFRQKALPEGTNLGSPSFQYANAELLIDRTAWDPTVEAHRKTHEIFDAILREIEIAETFIIADFFLWNAWTGSLEASGELRALSDGLANALIEKRIQNPNMPILVITDPINRIYGGHASEFFDRMAAAEIPVVFTDLSQLPDSNRIFAPQAEFWKQYLPKSERRLVPNPFEPSGEKLTLAELGRLFYFKANHRKVLVTGHQGSAPRMIIGSFNPADGSARHSNMAVLVDGAVAIYAAHSELAVAEWSSKDPSQIHQARRAAADDAISRIRAILPEKAALPSAPPAGSERGRVAWRSEGAIQDELIHQFNRSGRGDRIDIGVFYFSDRKVVASLREAIARGAEVRLLMDANRDAFGRKKNGIPNRMVAAELVEGGGAVEVRWAATHGEQFHAKVLRIWGAGRDLLFLGSSNWTRRNLQNLNLEANLLFEQSGDLGARFDQYFETIWTNADGLLETLPYEDWAESGRSLQWKTWFYRFQEWSGASTF